MAAIQGGVVDADEEKDIKSEPSSDGWGNNNASDGRVLSASPGSSAPAVGIKPAAGAPEDQQTLLAVLQFLRKNKLTESVDILRREAGLPEDSLKGADSSGAGSGGAAGGGDADGADASSLLSRVTVSSSAAAQAPTKGPEHTDERLTHMFTVNTTDNKQWWQASSQGGNKSSS